MLSDMYNIDVSGPVNLGGVVLTPQKSLENVFVPHVGELLMARNFEADIDRSILLVTHVYPTAQTIWFEAVLGGSEVAWQVVVGYTH